MLTRLFTGRLGRSVANAAARAAHPAPAPYPVQRALYAPVRAAAETANDPGAMQMWAGQSAPLARVEPAGALATRLWDEARVLLP